jgi:hypothetical protein
VVIYAREKSAVEMHHDNISQAGDASRAVRMADIIDNLQQWFDAKWIREEQWEGWYFFGEISYECLV